MLAEGRFRFSSVTACNFPFCNAILYVIAGTLNSIQQPYDTEDKPVVEVHVNHRHLAEIAAPTSTLMKSITFRKSRAPVRFWERTQRWTRMRTVQEIANSVDDEILPIVPISPEPAVCAATAPPAPPAGFDFAPIRERDVSFAIRKADRPPYDSCAVIDEYLPCG